MDFNKYYVYGLVNPNTNKVFYVGKGIKNRGYQHSTNYVLKNETNLHKKRTIEKILNEGKEVIVKFFVYNIQDEKLAYDLEEKIILSYGLENLTNICLGSNPPNHKGIKRSKEYKINMSKKLKGRDSVTRVFNATKCKTYNIYHADGYIIDINVPNYDIIKITRGLIHATIEKPLGYDKKQETMLIKHNKEFMLGWYVEETYNLVGVVRDIEEEEWEDVF